MPNISEKTALGHSQSGPRAQKVRPSAKAPSGGYLSTDDAALVIVRAARLSEALKPDIQVRIPEDLQEARLAICEGENGVRAWLKSESIRSGTSPRWQEIDTSFAKALAEPQTIPLRETEVEPDPPPRRMKLVGADELADMDLRVEWLVKNLLVAGEFAVVGAPKKTLKTSLMLDYCVSLASGTRVMDKFEVPRSRNVLMMSGESGKRAIRNTTERICRERDLTLRGLAGRLFFCFELPRLTEDDDLIELGEMIVGSGAEVVIIDPLYLCLAGSREKADTASIYSMGPILTRVNQVCIERGATLVIVHHFKQGSQEKKNGDEFAPPELDQLSHAGIQEAVRQWNLFSRRSRPDISTGRFELFMTVGGSAGHSGEYRIDIEQGIQDENFEGRYWRPTVMSMSEGIADAQAKKKAAARDKEIAEQLEQNKTHADHEQQILDALRKADQPTAKSIIIKATTMNGGHAQEAIARLIINRQIVETPKGSAKMLSLPDPLFPDR